MAVASLETGGQQTAPYFLNNKMTKKELQKYNDELYSRKAELEDEILEIDVELFELFKKAIKN